MSTIIIAEDDAAMRQFLETALTRAGHHVQAFSDGTSAFDYLKNIDYPADLLLTDIVMPGMDGIELAARTRALRPTLSILYITGFGVSAPNRLPSHDGTAQILSKPLHLNHLLSEVERHLADHSAH